MFNLFLALKFNYLNRFSNCTRVCQFPYLGHFITLILLHEEQLAYNFTSKHFLTFKIRDFVAESIASLYKQEHCISALVKRNNKNPASFLNLSLRTVPFG